MPTKHTSDFTAAVPVLLDAMSAQAPNTTMRTRETGEELEVTFKLKDAALLDSGLASVGATIRSSVTLPPRQLGAPTVRVVSGVLDNALVALRCETSATGASSIVTARFYPRPDDSQIDPTLGFSLMNDVVRHFAGADDVRFIEAFLASRLQKTRGRKRLMAGLAALVADQLAADAEA